MNFIKKFIIINIVIITFVVVYLLLMNKKAENDQKKEYEMKRIEEEEYQKERYEKYMLISDISSQYFSIIQTSTTDKLNDEINNFIEKYNGKNLFLYIRINDIYIKNGHRLVDVDSYSPFVKFIVFDNDNKLQNVNKYDRIDIELYIENIIVNRKEISIYSNIIELYRNYGERGKPYGEGRF
jgi:hypothetical protein